MASTIKLVLALSTALRVAVKTLPSWSDCLCALKAAAEEHLPLSSWYSGVLSPACWDSSPIACYLSDVVSGHGLSPLIRASIIGLRAKFDNARLNTTLTSRITVQKHACAKLFPVICPPTVARLLTKRLSDNIPDVATHARDADWDQIFSIMKTLGSHAAMCCFKTHANSWTTSRRFHEARQGTCLFGCAQPDDLAHYLRCVRLWRTIKFAVKGPVGRSPQERLGLVSPSKKRLQELAIAFTIFHTIKHSEQSSLQLARDTDNFNSFVAIARSIAETAARAHGRVQ